MGTIKLDKDEMLKIAGELSVLKEEINYILNKTHETYNVLRRENSVSTYSQERKLSDIQDLAYNLVREFDKISDNFYQAAKAYESTEDKLTNLVNINKDNNIKNIIAVNSMNNTYFDSDNTKSEKKEETTFDKLKELVQEGWQLVKDYYGLKIAVMDFVKDICDNINTCIDGYIESHEEFFEEFNEEHPILSVICFPLQQLVAVRDVTLNFLKEMTFELVSNIFGMLSYEYHGLIENPDETIKENIQSILIIKAILNPTSKGEVEIRDRVLLGIWEDIKADFNSEVINGNPYTASRYVYNLAIEIGSLFFGAGELKAAAGVKKADNVIDGMRAIDKVSDVKKLSNGEKWFNYFNKAYGAENVEWTSKIFEGNAGLRERVFANIEMSKVARESSNYSDFAKFERKFATKGISEADLLAEFAKSNGVESLPLSYEEILKFCGGRKDLAESLVIATKEAIGRKTIPELVDIFKLPNNPAAGSLSTYKTRIWYKWQESLIGSKLDYSKPLEEVAKDAFEMRNKIRTQARVSMSDQAWAEYLMQNEKNMTFEQLVKRNIAKGLTGDELWNKIIQSSMSSRDSVNSLFQLD